MKVHSFFCIIFLFLCCALRSQEHFLLPDSPAKCDLMKDGKFLREGDSAKKWYLTVKKDTQREYFNNGKDYIKYRINFIDHCTYKATVTGKSDGRHPMRIGDVVTNTIIETDKKFIKIKSVTYNTTEEIILEKQE